ncbi:MAG: hypothetical protein J0H12_06320 [Candidatus Paracaedimonas acanthamoebae]|uniref:Uncharacterized protein n=1 Tax=Candidatus Paracaedimonas acanthamoebae TaxID=244581 RepID=A0A8J7PRS4_9PROT|nr:hypothetical protein [Candidatus Paracaedimonas acanthamoebae]
MINTTACHLLLLTMISMGSLNCFASNKVEEIQEEKETKWISTEDTTSIRSNNGEKRILGKMPLSRKATILANGHDIDSYRSSFIRSKKGPSTTRN